MKEGSLKKMVSKNANFPDYFKGEITKKSQCKEEKGLNFTVKDKHTVLSTIEGEWTDSIKFDDIIYWDYNTFGHYSLERTIFTLPSDSTFREDLIVLKSGNLLEAQKSKTKLEEIQRKDKKLREKYVKNHK